MKSIAIVTDSNCGMSPAQVKDLGIYMLPMPFFIDDKEYLEDIDMNQSEFFQHLEQNPGCKVSTSQPTPESVTTLWDKLLKDYDEIVHIPMSSGLSSSMQTARMLAEDYDGRVRVVNNQRISGTLRYSAIEAIQQAKNGLSADEIGTWLEKTRFDSSILYHCSYSEVPETGRPHHSCSCSHRNHAPSETGSADPGRKAGRLLQGPHHDPGKKHYDESHQR